MQPYALYSSALFSVLCLFVSSYCYEGERESSSGVSSATQFGPDDLFTIEGKLVYVKSQETKSIDSAKTRIVADGSEYYGYLSDDRESFVISGIPSGSYLIEIYHPDFLFESARVDVSSKGKFRARRPDALDIGAAPQGQNQMPYPLRLKLLRKATYFQAKEAWRLTDMLMNPMVLMMILPLVVLMVIPKMLQSVDPEAHRELQSNMNIQPPDFSSMMTSFLGGGSAKPAITAAKKTERKERRRE